MRIVFRIILFLSAITLPGTTMCGSDKVELFRGGDGGYAVYRIPAITVTPQGNLLAACEARKTGSGDWDHVDIVMRRGDSAGRNWSPARLLIGQRDLPTDLRRNPAAIAAGLGREGAFTINNPTWIANSRTDETHLLYCAEYARAFIVTTRDSGITFDQPREITRAFEEFRQRDGYDWRVIAIGPGHGVTLANGRLVAAVWLSTGEGGHAHRPSICSTIYSDDGGVTWHAGEIVARDPHPLPNPSESAIVEVAPDRVMLSIRSESPRNRRALAWSSNGATHWTHPVFAEELWEPVCMGALARFEPRSPTDQPVLLFSNPASLDISPSASGMSASRARKNLTLRASYDSGKSWPASLTIESGPSAYSDLAVDAAGTVYCFYECGVRSPYETLTLARLNPATLKQTRP